MFSLAQPAFYPSCSPYEQLLLQQELQRRRQVEACMRQQCEAEELERRRAYERALLQAEYERRCAAEYERRRRAEAERLRRQSMFDGGMQDLFDAIYGRARSVSPQRENVHEEQNVTVNDKPVPQTSQTPSTPTTLPASEPVPSELENENEQTEDAAPQVDTTLSLTTVQSILASFASLRSNFTFPTHLDFLPSSSKLAYTPNNAPLHGYEHALTGLLTQLDAVESFGDDEVRKARKDAVGSIGLELEKLDELRTEAWKRPSQVESAVSPKPEVASLEPTVVSFEPKPQPESLEMEADPDAVPLPQHLGEDMSDEVSGVVVDSGAAETSTSTESTSISSIPSPTLQNLPPLPTSPELLASTLLDPDSTGPGVELEEYVDVRDATSGSQSEVDAEAVEKDRDLELIRDWDLDF